MTPEEFISILKLDKLKPEARQAVVLAFASRCPGQCKRFNEEWKTALRDIEAMPDDLQWRSAIAAGEFLSLHRMIKTTFFFEGHKYPRWNSPERRQAVETVRREEYVE
jgi:hypothetical protein